MINLTTHINLLGLRVKDRVTGFSGVVSSVCFDLYGCIQAIVNPGVDDAGKPRETFWFDVNRLVILDHTPVMDRPQFEWTPQAIASGEKGPSERPGCMKV